MTGIILAIALTGSSMAARKADDNTIALNSVRRAENRVAKASLRVQKLEARLAKARAALQAAIEGRKNP